MRPVLGPEDEGLGRVDARIRVAGHAPRGEAALDDQLQLGRERDVAPITRSYIEAEEARIAEREEEFLERVVASAHQALDA